MLWKIIPMIILLTYQSAASEVVKMEEPTIVVGMSCETVTSILKERLFNKLSERAAPIGNKKRTLRYEFKPRNDITPIHPSWYKSQIEFLFLNDKLVKIDWYKKDGTALKLDMDKIYLGPK